MLLSVVVEYNNILLIIQGIIIVGLILAVYLLYRLYKKRKKD
jgi:membrane protein DedA with SNARE-associated domain